MPTAITASDYSIELRDKNGNLKQYLTPFVSKVSWEWNRIGGCGRCSITINKAYRDIIFAARDDIRIKIQNLDPNHLTNNGFEIWTAGASSAPDNWTLIGASATIAKESSIINSGIYSAKLTRVGADCSIYQQIHTEKGIIYWKSRDVTFGCWVYATVADRARLNIDDGIDNTSSSYHTGNSTWQWLTVTRTINASLNVITLALQVNTGDTAAYFDGAIVVEGTTIAGATITPRSKLVYRGFIANIVPTLKINQDITLDVRGYFDLLKKIIVHTSGNTRTYTSKTVAFIADDIADTFIVPKTPITIAGALTDGAFTADTLEFLGTVDDALRTLSELQGDIEYGVDEDLVFYWKTESEVISHRFFIGNNVSILERRVKWDNLVNKLYLVGGDVAGVKYKTTAETTDSQSLYYLVEEIINNSSIITASVAAQYLGAILTERSNPEFSIRAQIKNTDLRLEDIIPMGLITFYDATYDKDSAGDLVGDIIGESFGGIKTVAIKAGGSGYTTGAQVLTVVQAGAADGTINVTVSGGVVTAIVSVATQGTNYTTTGVGGTGANGLATTGGGGTGCTLNISALNITSNTGSNIVIGETAEGGSNIYVGGQYSAQIDRISYSLSNTSGRFNIEVQLGDTVLETAAKIKRLELALASVTQY